jgi:hypothetical protein
VALGNTILDAGLMVGDNALLPNIIGIEELVSASSITVVNNPSMTELGGLEKLESCDGLTVANNAVLERLGFPLLETAQAITITTHPLLESISLPALETAGSLTIAQNDVLTDVGSLESLTSLESLVFAANASFPQCEVDALDARLMACTSCAGNDTTATCN